jgi:hypothetical protein
VFVAVGVNVAVGNGVLVGVGVAVGSEVAVGACVGTSVLLTAVADSVGTKGVFAVVGLAGATATGTAAVSVACTALATTAGSGVGLPHAARATLKTMRTMHCFMTWLLSQR